jgi:hypothetical protein
MTTQGNSPLVPGLAAAAGRLMPDRDDDERATDDGVPVGEADAKADAERTGAERDDLASPGRALAPDVPGAGDGTDDGVPVGDADVDADRRRSGADDTAV